jgi:hypothetical protein
MRILILMAALAATSTACGGKPSSNLPPKSPEFNMKKASNGAAPVSLNEMLKASGMPPLDESPGFMEPDTNGNGVRDDIEAWINSLPHSAEQKTALMQFAAAQQKTLSSTGSVAEAQAANVVARKATGCLRKRFTLDETASVAGRIESYTANTLERAMSYTKHIDLLHNTGFALERGDTCEHRVQSAFAAPASSNSRAIF